jgi:hypothetical protein
MKPVRQREMVDHVRTAWQVSIRRACRALPVERSSYHYRSRRAGQAPLSKRIKEIDDVKNLSQIWAVAPALVKLALRDDRRSQFNKEPPWKRIAEGPSSAM